MQFDVLKTDVSADVVDEDQSPPRKKQKVTSKIFEHLQQESSNESSFGDEATCRHSEYKNEVFYLREQNRRLRSIIRGYFKEEHGATHEDTQEGSIIFTLRFSHKSDLETFWRAYQCGQLSRELSRLLLHSGLVDLQEDMDKLGIQVSIDESRYRQGLAALGK